MLSVRLQILEGMNQSILNLKANQEIGNGLSSSQVEFKIKRYLFPEIFTKVEQLEEMLNENLTQEMESEFGVNDDKKCKPYRKSLSNQPTKPKHYTGRKRGRPRKSDQKNANPLKPESLSAPPENKPLNLIEVTFDQDGDHQVFNDPGDDYQPEMEDGSEDDTIEDTDYFNDTSNSDSDYEPEVAPKQPRRRPGRHRIHPPRTTPSQGRRGRPRIHPPKPPPRQGQMGRRPLYAPGTFYNRNLSKSKRFHWSRCTICDARYTSTEDHTAHMALHSQRDPTSKGPLDCPQCPFPARDPQELDYHLRRWHLQKPQVLKQSCSCPICPFTTNRWKYLKAHLDIEHPTVPLEELGPSLSLKCSECGQQLQTLQRYQAHLRMMHPKDISKGPVNCPHCGIKFLSQSLLTYHVNSAHGRPLRHICDECGKGYQFPKEMERHREAHRKTGDPSRKRDHICEECGLDFWEEVTLRRHYENKHSATRAPEDNDKVFQCKYCDVRSGLASFIKRHTLEEHKGEMAWKCDKCERRYTNAAGLKRHVRLIHGNEEWPCPHCGKIFKGEDYMKDHVKRFCKLKDLAVEGAGNSNVKLGESDGAGQHKEHKYSAMESTSGSCPAEQVIFDGNKVIN